MTAKTKEPIFTAESIQVKIDELIAQRDTFVQEAQQRIAHFNGSIQVLDGLLSENGQGEAQDDKGKE